MEPFVARIPVRFGEVDRAGIVYYPRYFHFFHVAFEEFFAARVGVAYDEMIEVRKVGFPAVHVEGDYRSPLRFGDPVDIEVTVARLGTKSVDFRYRARVGDRLASEAVVTVACVNMDTFEAMEVPEPYRGIFASHVQP